MLTCYKCGALDDPQYDGVKDGAPVFVHLIEHDAYSIGDRSKLTMEEIVGGWHYKLLNGINIKYRDICRACFSQQEDTKYVNAEYQKKLKTLQEDRDPKRSFFYNICNFD